MGRDDQHYLRRSHDGFRADGARQDPVGDSAVVLGADRDDVEPRVAVGAHHRLVRPGQQAGAHALGAQLGHDARDGPDRVLMAVVQEDDALRPHLERALDDDVDRRPLPVEGVDRPVDRDEPGLAHVGVRIRARLPVGRTDKGVGVIEDPGGLRQFLEAALLGHVRKMGVGIGVVRHLAGRPLQLDQFGVGGGALADIEEGRDRRRPLERADKPLRRARERPVIERERVVALRRRALEGCRDRLGRVLARGAGVGRRTERKRRVRSRDRQHDRSGHGNRDGGDADERQQQELRSLDPAFLWHRPRAA